MKKVLFSTLAASTLMLAASCSQDDSLTSGADGNEQMVSFTVKAGNGAQTRAIAEGVNVGEGNMANTLVYALYEKGKTDETPLILGQKAEEDDADGVFIITVPMAKDLNYELLLLAYNEENSAFDVNYKANDLTSVNLQELKLKSTLSANQEAYDAFVGHETVSVNAEAVTVINLKRPFAQVNAATTAEDLADAETLKAVVASSQLVIEDVPTIYNVFTGEASATQDVTYTNAAILSTTDNKYETLTVKEVSYNYLTLAYVLAGENATSEKSLHNATFTFNRADGQPVSTISVANLPIQRNYRTNVIGRLLTSSESYKVVIDAEFDGDHSVSYWDGKTVKEPSVVDGAYVITSAPEFAWLSGKTLANDVVLAADIDMSNYTFKGMLSGGHALDGKGYTLSNVVLDYTTEGQDWSSLFVTGGGDGDNSDIDVKNLTVVGANVIADKSEYGNAAVIASYAEGTVNIENVTVKNSKVNGTLNMGALVGLVTANGETTIKNCVVEGAELNTFDLTNESGNVGVVAGRVVGKLTVENTSVANSTINAYIGRSGQERAVAKYIGNFYGKESANLVVTDGSIDNVVINVLSESNTDQVCIYGDFLGGWQNEGGTVTINGVSIEKENSSIITTAEQLATALSSAQDGDVIGIGAAINGAVNANGKKVTIVGMTEEAGFVYTSGTPEWSSDITVKNLTITSGETCQYFSGINCSGTITFENCDFVGTATCMNGNFVYNNCTFTNSTKGNYAAWLYSGTATYTDCTFNGVDRAAKVYTEEGNTATATYNNCTFNSTEANKAAVEIDARNNNGSDKWYTVNINNATVNGMGEGALTGSVYCNIEGTNANVYIDGKKFVVPAVLNEGVWEIYTAEGLSLSFANEDNVSDGVYKCSVKLMNDIDMEGADMESITRPAGIKWGGDFNNMVFDGNGKTISNVKLTNGSGEQVGLFSVFFGTIKNLNLKNVEGEGSKMIGAIAGQMVGTIENCTVEGVTLSGTKKVGGLVGQSSGLKITNCKVTDADLSSTEKEVGGLVGCIDGDAKNETYTGNTVAGSVKSPASVGALYGKAYVTVSESDNNVSGMTVTEE